MPEPTLAGKVFMVTGGGSGIGLETAKLLLVSGAKVAVCDANETSLDVFTSGLSPDEKARAMTGVADISKRPAVAAFLEKTIGHFGALDGVANVAGVGGTKFGAQDIWETDDESYEFIMGVNVKGLFNVLAESLKPGMIRRPGSIVHVGSEYSFRGCRGGAVYSASKHGALGMVKSASLESRGPDGVRVNAVLPYACPILELTSITETEQLTKP